MSTNAATGETIYVGTENVDGFGSSSVWVAAPNGSFAQTTLEQFSGRMNAINGI